MLPFIEILGLKIPMYGVMITSGVALGVIAAVFFPCKKSISREDLFFAFCYAAIGTYIGSKLMYIATIIPELFLAENSPKFSLELLLNLLRYGFIFYGGVFGAIIGIYIYTRKYKLSFINMTETMIVSVPLIHSVGRIGCFCAGCCYGIPADPPWGVFFRADSAALYGVSLFPIQLLESAINLLIFIFLFWFSRKPRKNGQILGFYFVGYAFQRFFLEFFRYDQKPLGFIGLTLSQIISIAIIPIGILLLVKAEIFKRIFTTKAV